MRVVKSHPINLTEKLKKQLLNWAQQFNEVIWLDSNNHIDGNSRFHGILAVDALTSIRTDFHQAFDQLEEYQSVTKDWIFGYLTYDLKNALEVLSSNNFDGLQFSELFFFQPKKIFFFFDHHVEMHYLKFVEEEMDIDLESILCHSESRSIVAMNLNKTNQNPTIKIHLRTSKDSYFEKLNNILYHIQQGDIYEANFCQEFYSEDTDIDPVKTYFHLNQISESPFATFLKLDDHYAISASPERFISKKGNIVISQPIKGTAKRHGNSNEDRKIKEKLYQDPKERSENIMIVDLVRNDLSRFAEKGSVSVKELCEVYSFKQVHQLISTVACNVSDTISPVTILKCCFPMGSMTGAPKISAMKIIESHENTKRGLYSGSVGYISPEGDFDFNVIIRSILYNKSNKYVSYSVGGAITSRSIPEKEYEECLVKAKAMREALEG